MTPDFLSPPRPGPALTSPISRAGPRHGARAGGPGSGTFASQRSGQPVTAAAAWRLLDDPAAARDMLADLLEQCWRLLIAPHWPRLRDLLQADMLYRTQVLGDYGLERVLDDLDPRAHWTGHAMVIDWPVAQRYRLAGAGLLLTPSVFVWPSLAAVIDPPARPTLVYSARGIAELWQPAHTPHSDALALLLGRTRAAC